MPVRPLNYESIAWAVKEINTHLYQSGENCLLRVEVDKHKMVKKVDFVPISEALRDGFEPMRILK